MGHVLNATPPGVDTNPFALECANAIALELFFHAL
jgi:hypothetical protein